MQKILSLVWFKIYPAHFGGQKGIALFNKHLAAHFALDCLCAADNQAVSDTGVSVHPLLPAGKSQFLNPAVWKKILRFFKKRNYSYLILEFPYYGLLGRWLKSEKTRLIIHTHNIEAQRFKSLGKRGWQLLYLYEKWSLQQADLVLFKTDGEKKYAIDRLGLKETKCYVLPYGVDEAGGYNKGQCRHFLAQKHGIQPEEKILLFAGTIDYGPNAEAVEALYKTIAPLLKLQGIPFKILVCGRNQEDSFRYLKALKNEHIIQTGFVDDIAPYFAGADVFINPVQSVHGVQTKLFDALNFNLNVVSFDTAAQGLPDYIRHKIFLSPPGDYAHFTQNIRKALEKKGDTPADFYKDYSWEGIVGRFAEHLKLTFAPVNNA